MMGCTPVLYTTSAVLSSRELSEYRCLCTLKSEKLIWDPRIDFGRIILVWPTTQRYSFHFIEDSVLFFLKYSIRRGTLWFGLRPTLICCHKYERHSRMIIGRETETKTEIRPFGSFFALKQYSFFVFFLVFNRFPFPFHFVSIMATLPAHPVEKQEKKEQHHQTPPLVCKWTVLSPRTIIYLSCIFSTLYFVPSLDDLFVSLY